MSIAGTSSLVPEPPLIKPPEALVVTPPEKADFKAPNPVFAKLPNPPVTMSARLEMFLRVISWKKLVAASVSAVLRSFAPLMASFNP